MKVTGGNISWWSAKSATTKMIASWRVLWYFAQTRSKPGGTRFPCTLARSLGAHPRQFPYTLARSAPAYSRNVFLWRRKKDVWSFLYKQCTSSLPLFQRNTNKQTHEVVYIYHLTEEGHCCSKLFQHTINFVRLLVSVTLEKREGACALFVQKTPDMFTNLPSARKTLLFKKERRETKKRTKKEKREKGAKHSGWGAEKILKERVVDFDLNFVTVAPDQKWRLVTISAKSSTTKMITSWRVLSHCTQIFEFLFSIAFFFFCIFTKSWRNWNCQKKKVTKVEFGMILCGHPTPFFFYSLSRTTRSCWPRWCKQLPT